MKIIDVNDLNPGMVEEDIYHKSGEVIFQAGSKIDQVHITCLLKTGIREMYALKGDTVEDIRRRGLRKPISVSDLQKSLKKELMVSIMDDDGHVVVKSGQLITKKLIASLKNKRRLFYLPPDKDGVRDEINTFQKTVAHYQEKTEKKETPEKIAHDLQGVVESIDTYDPQEVKLSTLRIDRAYEDIDPEGVPLSEMVQRNGHRANHDLINDLRFSCEEITDNFFEAVRNKTELKGSQVMKVVETVINSLLSNYSYSAMAATRHTNSYDTYLRDHALNMSLLAAILATELNYNAKQVMEITAAAYLANVGSLRIDPELLKKVELTEAEIVDIRRAPVLGIDILQKLTGVPRMVPIAAYQYRERLDGSGYPRQRSGSLIHPYSRIVSIVDAYDAMLAPKPWRKPFLPYHAMEELIHQSARGKFDRNFMRALLKGLSLFPIGSLIELDGERIAWVTESNPDQLDKPLVKVVKEKGVLLEEPYTLDLRKEGKVVKPLNPRENQDIPSE